LTLRNLYLPLRSHELTIAHINYPGALRRLVRELLYRVGGLKEEEIGSLFGVGASAVSRERKRLMTLMAKDEVMKSRAYPEG
jgi:predicted transcriptional regulator